MGSAAAKGSDGGQGGRRELQGSGMDRTGGRGGLVPGKEMKKCDEVVPISRFSKICTVCKKIGGAAAASAPTRPLLLHETAQRSGSSALICKLQAFTHISAGRRPPAPCPARLLPAAPAKTIWRRRCCSPRRILRRPPRLWQDKGEAPCNGWGRYHHRSQGVRSRRMATPTPRWQCRARTADEDAHRVEAFET